MSKVVKPYSESDGKKAQVGRMFDKIAPYYDLLNRVLSVGIDTIWRTKAIKKLKPFNPKIILDVATGTGDLAIEIEKQLKPDQVIGVDISNEMLEVGRKKMIRKNLQDKITLKYGDSENLPFEDNTFDALTVAFGVRNYENLERGLLEMKRVLKENGHLVVLEFSKPTIPPFKQLFHFYFKNILPVIGRITSKDPKAYGYLYESVQAFPDGKDFERILQKTGYRCTHSQTLTLGICSIYTAEK